MSKFDVLIVGGGMVGAACAIGFAQQGKRVAVVEGRKPHSFAADQPWDVRVSAISMASVKLLAQLGAWKTIESMRLCPYKRLETWEHPGCRTRFHSDSVGLEQLGYIVENRVIQLGLWQEFASYDNISVFCPSSISEFDWQETVTVTLNTGECIEANYVIGADGANSQVRNEIGIGLTAWDYRQHCMLITVETELPQQDITWQQFTPSGPRSFLPLAGQNGSLVWYDNPTRIKQLMAMNVEQLETEIALHFPEELGMVKVKDRGAFPLTRRHAQRYFQKQAVLVGDAAHTINPLAGQGVNLGFRDVKVLLEECLDTIDVEAFGRYQRRRKPDNLLMQTGMDVFYKGFSNEIAPLKLARNLALKVAENSGPIKQNVLKYALGLN